MRAERVSPCQEMTVLSFPSNVPINTPPPLKFSGGAGIEGREIESLPRDDCPELDIKLLGNSVLRSLRDSRSVFVRL